MLATIVVTMVSGAPHVFQVGTSGEGPKKPLAFGIPQPPLCLHRPGRHS